MAGNTGGDWGVASKRYARIWNSSGMNLSQIDQAQIDGGENYPQGAVLVVNADGHLAGAGTGAFLEIANEAYAIATAPSLDANGVSLAEGSFCHATKITSDLRMSLPIAVLNLAGVPVATPTAQTMVGELFPIFITADGYPVVIDNEDQEDYMVYVEAIDPLWATGAATGGNVIVRWLDIVTDRPVV